MIKCKIKHVNVKITFIEKCRKSLLLISALFDDFNNKKPTF